MAYADLLESEGIRSEYLAVIKPRRRIVTWSHLGSGVYQADFDYGEITSVQVDGVDLTQIASGTPSAGQFVYDVDNETVTAKSAGSDNLNNVYSVAVYEIYIGTSGEHWHRDPINTSTRDVYFDPLIEENGAPVLKTSSTDVLFGFLPSQTASLRLINAEHFLEKHVYDSSFNRASIKVYHWLESLEEDNLHQVFDGQMGNVTYNSSSVTIEVYDKLDKFNQEFRTNDTSFFSTDDFAALNNNFSGKPIRYVFGVVDGYVPVNIDFVQESPTTSDNRDWVVIGEQSNISDVSQTVPASPVSTTTRTYVPSSSGYRVGDSVWLDAAAGPGSDQYGHVTAVGVGYVDHTTFGAGAVAGDVLRRAFVGNITIHQNEQAFKPLYGRDYTVTSFAAGTSGFQFSTSLEANLSMDTLTTTDTVLCRVYGKTNDLTIDGLGFGSDDSETKNLTHPIVIIYDLLKRLGITESEIDTSAFEDLEAAMTEAVGFAIPSSSSDKFPTYKELFVELMKTSLLRLYLDNDSNWTLSQLAPLSTASKTLDTTEILEGNFRYVFDYRDVASDIIVEYAEKEQAEEPGAFQSSNSVVSATSDVARRIHNVNKTKTFESLHFKESDAQTLADRLSYIYGDRQGVLTFSGKNRLFDVLLSDTIEISRPALPGYEFESETDRTRKFSVMATDKDLNDVTLTMDDQKGINDNSSSW